MSKWGPTGDANYLKVSRNTHLLFNNTRVSSLAQHQIPKHHPWFYPFWMSFGIFQNIVMFRTISLPFVIRRQKVCFPKYEVKPP